MIKKLLFVLLIFSNVIFTDLARATEFDELDKPPEGSHEGQFFLGAFFAFGWLF
jgi:hypothetical protein